MQNLELMEKPIGKWDNISQIMTKYGYVYNPMARKWFNHELRTAWTMAMLIEDFPSEVEYETYAAKVQKDPSFLRFIQAQLEPLMNRGLADQPSPGRVDN